MSWLILAGFAALAFGALWRFGALPRSALELAVAALVVGMIGYAVQGNPLAPGAPVEARKQQRSGDTEAMQARPIYLGGYGDDAAWLNFSDALIRTGKTREGVLAIRSGLAKSPRSVDLWVGLGNALVAHADGLLTPAARLAYQQATAIDPAHPAPRFFLGLALAQSGQFGEARRVWRALLAATPADARWRKDLEARLAVLDTIAAG